MSFCVQERQCSTCIYHKGSPLNLKRLESEALRKDSYRVCHHSDTAVCRGFWNKHAHSFNLGRIMQRLNCVTFVNHDTTRES